MLAFGFKPDMVRYISLNPLKYLKIKVYEWPEVRENQEMRKISSDFLGQGTSGKS